MYPAEEVPFHGSLNDEQANFGWVQTYNDRLAKRQKCEVVLITDPAIIAQMTDMERRCNGEDVPLPGMPLESERARHGNETVKELGRGKHQQLPDKRRRTKPSRGND